MQLIDLPLSPRLFFSPLAANFIAEWEQLDRLPSTHRRIASWALDSYEHTDGLDGLLRAAGALGAVSAGADELVRALVERSSSDDLAARVVLQRVLPALIAIAKRRANMIGCSRQAAFDELVAQAWIVIRTYPIDRRPQRVAGGLVREIEYQTFTRARRLKAAGERPVETNPLDEREVVEPDPEPMFVVIELLRTARNAGTVPAEDLRFAAAWASGASTEELARRFDMCERSVRNRRLRVASGLRAVARQAGELCPAA